MLTKTCEMIAVWGIDPNRISRDDLTAEGYYTLVYDEHGNRQFNSDHSVVREWHRWPDGAGGPIYDMYLRESANE